MTSREPIIVTAQHHDCSYVIVYHPAFDTHIEAIEHIVEEYRSEFQQEAVLFTSSDAHVCISAESCLSTQFLHAPEEKREQQFRLATRLEELERHVDVMNGTFPTYCACPNQT